MTAPKKAIARSHDNEWGHACRTVELVGRELARL